MAGRMKMCKAVREAVAVAREELAKHGIEDFQVVKSKRHFRIVWDGGCAGFGGTPSCSRALGNFRSVIRRRLKGRCE